MSKVRELLQIKDYVTLLGTTLGLFSLIVVTFGGRAMVSVGFFLLAFTFGTDLADGYIARKTGTVNEIGKELDSLNDSLTFGIAPATLTFVAFKTGTYYDLLLAIGAVIFALGGILRLARFNISEEEGYTGVPTPLTGLILLTFFYANYFYSVAVTDGGPNALTYPFPLFCYYIIPFILIFLAWSNITVHISFGKKGKSVYVTFVIFAPLCPIFAILGILNPTFLIGFISSFFFFSFFIVEITYVIYGIFKKASKKDEKSSKNKKNRNN
ncbi:MAG: hypothetical protein GF317_00020 [Candidatus Lokiarchaeota archaeon]|nr:hypothetical protein [Candidatus Lokiarchaeota archaeon]MBD3198372.1 hypothetical protein [Candidatus Lokiarchaeota archaeon]